MKKKLITKSIISQSYNTDYCYTEEQYTDIDNLIEFLKLCKSKGANKIGFSGFFDVDEIDIDAYNVRLESDEEFEIRQIIEEKSKLNAGLLKAKMEEAEYLRLKEKYE